MNRSSDRDRQPTHAAMTKLSSLLERRLAASERLARESSHPDADVLSAFAERMLSPKERESVMAHLAGCAECREILVLSSEMQPNDLTPSGASETRAVRWWTWRLAAVAALAVIIATWWLPIQRSKPGSHVTTVQAPPPAVPTSSLPAADSASPVQPVAVSPDVEPNTSEVPAKKQTPRRARVNESAKRMVVSPPAELKVNPSEKMFTSASLPVPRTTYIAPLFPQAVIPPSPSPQTSVTAAAPSSPSPQTSVTAAAPSTQLAATAAAAPVSNDEQAAEATVAAQASLSKAKASLAAPRKGAALGPSLFGVRRFPGASKPESAPVARAQETAHAQDIWMLPSPANAGVVEKSEDGGKTWHEIPVDSNTEFDALASAGKEVWVGGANGKLFRSVDSGVHWSPVAVLDAAMQLDEIISSIDIRGSTVTLKTASGASWTSVDSGAHWHLQR